MPSPIQKVSPGSKHGKCRYCNKETTVYKIVYYLCRDCLCPDMTDEEKQLSLEFYSGRDENFRPKPATLSYGETKELIKVVDKACRKHGLIKKDFIRNHSRDRGECKLCAIEHTCGRNTNTKEDGLCESYIRKSKESNKSKNSSAPDESGNNHKR